jgi:aminoglycoside phosphotransferase (APT) family kinase protein
MGERTDRAAAAAAVAGRSVGLRVDEPRVLHDMFSIVVHLAPSPVVARVATVTIPGTPDVRARQERELAVAAWLDARDVPVVRPHHREPLEVEGFAMTLWEYVELAPRAETVNDEEGLALVRQLHAALRDYPAPLPFLAPLAMIGPCLRYLVEHPMLIDAADLARARREWEVLAPIVASRDAFAAKFPGARLQPIHGDAPAYNVIHTATGPRYADFEEVTIGPREWDLALYPTQDYGELLDDAAQRAMNDAGLLRVVACHALVPQLPALATGIAPLMDLWRQSATEMH